MSNSLFIDIGSCQRQKDGEDCFGDTIYSKKIPAVSYTHLTLPTILRV